MWGSMTARSDERQFANDSASYGGTTLYGQPTLTPDPEMALILRDVVKAAVLCMAHISQDLYFQASKGEGESEKAEEFSVALRNAEAES